MRNENDIRCKSMLLSSLVEKWNIGRARFSSSRGQIKIKIKIKMIFSFFLDIIYYVIYSSIKII